MRIISLPSYSLISVKYLYVRCEQQGGKGERGANSEILAEVIGKKVCRGRPGRTGVNGCWFTRGCREIDKQISRGLAAREGKHVRVIKIHLGQNRDGGRERQRAVGGAGGQEIAAKQAWRGIKGWFCMKTSGKGGLTIRGSKTTKKKKGALPHNGGLYTRAFSLSEEKPCQDRYTRGELSL